MRGLEATFVCEHFNVKIYLLILWEDFLFLGT